MSLKQQIYQHTRSYLDGEISVTAFEEWFIAATWPVDVERDADLGPLVSHITAILADYKDQEMSESELRSHLRASGSLSSINTG